MKVTYYWNIFLDYAMYEANDVYANHSEWRLRTLDGSLEQKKGVDSSVMTGCLMPSVTLPDKTTVRETLAACLFLIVLTCLFFREPILEGKVFYVWDHTLVYMPTQVSNAHDRAAGVIPLWNRHVFLGYPHSAEPESSGIYPPALLFNIIREPGAAYTAFIVFHYLLALAATMYLARAAGVGVAGQTAAAVVFVYGGSFVAQCSTLVTTLAWTPLILGLHMVALQRRSYGLAALAGVVLGIQTLGCQPHISVYTVELMLLCIPFSVYLWQRPSGFIPATKLTGLILLIGLGISAPQLFYFLEYLAMTNRGQGLSYEELIQGSLPPHYLLQLLTPGLVGTDRDYVSGACFYEFRVYFGLLSLGLIALGWKARSQFVWLFRIVLVLGLFLALGRYIGVYHILGMLPVFKSMISPCRYLLIASLGAAVLTGLGVDRLVRGQVEVDRIRRIFSWSYGVLAVVLLGSGVLGWWGTNGGPILSAYQWFITLGMEADLTFRPLPGRGPARLASYTQSAIQAGVLATVCVAYFLLLGQIKRRGLLAMFTLGLLASDLLITNSAVNRYKPPNHFSSVPPTVEFLRKDRGMWRMYRSPDLDWYEEALEPDPGHLLYGIPSIYGLDTLSVAPGALLPAAQWFFSDMSYRELAIYNVKYLLRQQEDAVLDSLSLERFRKGKLRIYEVPDWQPRVAIRDKIVVMSNLNAVRNLLNSDQFTPSESVIINEVPTPLPGHPLERPPATHTVDVVSYSAQRVKIKADLAYPGILVLSDLYYPGWRATSNGRPIKILVANGIVRGLALGSGRHEIEFIYRPKSFYLGLYVSAVVLVILAGWGLVSFMRMLRRVHPTSDVTVRASLNS